ncbi:MAG TPA: DUF2254 domain-containing protein [Longimicrobiales bacterium]|nr:DUF2254 domain-containing protein [Longimicrobiales bacterium]
MSAWIRNVWSAVRNGLWFIPGVLAIAGGGLAAALMRGERAGLLGSSSSRWWLYQGDADGARTVLNVITGSLITVTGVVFSVTIVAVQLASSQYTPRVLRNFSSDRGNQFVLGLFIGTFMYAVAVLRTVRSSGGLAGEFVPRVGITVSVVLLTICVGALIYFINHVAREIHVTAIMDRAASDTIRNVRELFPENIGRADANQSRDPRLLEEPSVTLAAEESGYLHLVDEDTLFEGGERERVTIGMKPRIGDYVLRGRPLAELWSEAGVSADARESIRRAFVLGPERTPDQDVGYGIIQISDIAIKALSPSINDPTTGVRCINRLTEILAELGSRNPPEPRRTRDGVIRFIATYMTFDDAMKLAFDDIRHFGAPIPIIAGHLLHALGELRAVTPRERAETIRAHAAAVLFSARDEASNPRDRAALDEAERQFRSRMESGAPAASNSVSR